MSKLPSISPYSDVQCHFLHVAGFVIEGHTDNAISSESKKQQTHIHVCKQILARVKGFRKERNLWKDS